MKIWNDIPNLIITNEDCMNLMSRYDDKYFDVAIVDPPYFKGPNKKKFYGADKSKTNVKRNTYKEIDSWDVPNVDYFKELFRVSKNQIIWGGNYYITDISKALDSIDKSKNLVNTPSWVVWDKNNGKSTFADGELAWTSFKKSLKIFKYTWNGMIQEDMKNKEIRIHPTQKPVALYKYLLDKFTVNGDKILDTHLGSGSIAIASHNENKGYQFIGCEKDEHYYQLAIDRIGEQIKVN